MRVFQATADQPVGWAGSGVYQTAMKLSPVRVAGSGMARTLWAAVAEEPSGSWVRARSGT
ncbi:MAG: hypothetical protein C0475_08140 [Planctomyces sp.]|nr:hypothetical protein [Planctomyces sp.]